MILEDLNYSFLAFIFTIWKDNIYIGTQRQIAERCNVSVKTVNTAITTLVNANFLRQENQGAIRINPNIIFKGEMTNRQNILYKYSNLEVKQKETQDVEQVNEQESI